MEFTKSLIKGKLIKRYKRFFADVKINKDIVTAHCPNTGSMKGLLDKDNTVFLSKNDDPKRKLKFTLEIIEANKKLVGVNTHRANKIVADGLNKGLINEFKSIKNIKAEFKFSSDTRFDFLCDKNIIEVKNVTLLRDQKVAEFPDAVTERGTKHLKKLIEALKKGYKSYLIFLVQIQNMEYFRIAKDIDSKYYENYLIAKNSVVKFLAYRCLLSNKEIKIEKKINIIDE